MELSPRYKQAAKEARWALGLAIFYVIGLSLIHIYNPLRFCLVLLSEALNLRIRSPLKYRLYNVLYLGQLSNQAILASRNNAEQNGVADRLQLFLSDDKPADLKADVVVANILAGPLKELYPIISQLVKERCV